MATELDVMNWAAARRPITMKLLNNPGYPTTNADYLGTIHHSKHGVAAAINCDYGSTFEVRRYLCGLEQPNYPMPAIVTETSMWRNCIMLFKDNDTEPFKMWVGN